jgi:hypothetical protein
VRPLLVDHLHNHAHGLGDDQNVRENDGGIEETAEALNRLQRQGGCDFWASAALEEIAASLGLVVFGEVSAGCAASQFVCVGVLVVLISYPAASPKWAAVRLSRLFSGVSAAFPMFRLEIKSQGKNKIEKLLTNPVLPSGASHFEAAEIGRPWLRLLMFWSSRFLWCSRLPRQLSSYRMDFN